MWQEEKEAKRQREECVMTPAIEARYCLSAYNCIPGARGRSDIWVVGENTVRRSEEETEVKWKVNSALPQAIQTRPWKFTESAIRQLNGLIRDTFEVPSLLW